MDVFLVNYSKLLTGFFCIATQYIKSKSVNYLHGTYLQVEVCKDDET